MTPQEIANIIVHARSAPLANMDHAEAVGRLLNKLAAEYVQQPPSAAPVAPPAEPAPVEPIVTPLTPTAAESAAEPVAS